MTRRTLRPARTTALVATLALTIGLAACGDDGSDSGSDAGSDNGAAEDGDSGATAAAESDSTLVLYSGRNEELVDPVIEDFTEETGIEVEVRYGGTAEMAAQLLEEGDSSPADVFLAQDAGALGAVSAGGLLEGLPQETLDLVPETYRSSDNTWVGVTGRSRVLIYNTDAVPAEELPASVFDLTEPEWEGRVGIAPTNASFQAFVTAMRIQHGDDVAQQWLDDLAANDPQIREGNGMIVADVNDGVIDTGLVNHYYLYELAEEQGSTVEEMGAAHHFFPDGDTGALVNISGVGLVGEPADGDGQAFVDYLLSDAGQEYFRSETHEYPMVEGIEAEEGLPSLEELEVPEIDLNDLEDLQTTVEMISQAGLS